MESTLDSENVIGSEDHSPSGQQENGDSAGPVGKGKYQVIAGDCMASIAFSSGFWWKKLWDLSENQELKFTRKNPNILLAGDRVYIPPLEIKEQPCDTDKRHPFVRKGVPAHFIIVIEDLGVPRANEPYTLIVDGKAQNGVTGEDGKISASVRPDACSGRLLLGEDQDEITIHFGHIDPITEICGVQSRLKNLGFFDYSVDNRLTSETTAAIAEFQRSRDMAGNGELNDQTKQALLDEHGS